MNPNVIEAMGVCALAGWMRDLLISNGGTEKITWPVPEECRVFIFPFCKLRYSG